MKLHAVASVPLDPERTRGRPPGKPAEPQYPKPPAPHPPTTRKLKNWLLAYQQYTASTESPDVFHMWCGLSAIAAVTVRQLYLQFTYGNIYTNIYVGLVGRPATKKTTAIKSAYNLVRKVVPDHMLPSAGSAAAIIAALADMKEFDAQAGNLVSEELGSLLASTDRDLVNTLTDLFDCNEDIYKRTIGRGKERIAKPWLNFVFGTTPQWMGANMDSSMAEGGFFSRIIFVHCDEIKFTSPRPEVTDEHEILKAALINDLVHINSLRGKVTFSKEAGEAYDTWYMDTSRVTNADPRTEGYLVRKAVHVLKVAMLLMLSERDTLVLERQDIERALTLLASIEKGISAAVGSVGRNSLLSHSQSVLRQIQAGGKNGVPYKDVLRKHVHNISRAELDEILGTLHTTGDIRKDMTNNRYQLYYVVNR